MKASDVMTKSVVSVSPEATLLEMLGLMIQNQISGMPVIDDDGQLVGIVTEGDCLRRAELGTEKNHSSWTDFFSSTSTLADRYIRSHARKVSEIMTMNPVTADKDAPLETVIQLMEKNRIKRVPIVENGSLVGIVSRSNVMKALMSRSLAMPAADTSNNALAKEVRKAIDQLTWAPRSLVDIRVTDGIVELRGVAEPRTSDAMTVAAENVPGIKTVRNYLAWVEPISGMVIEPNPEPQTKRR